MCLITYQRKPKITKKDIVVLKEVYPTIYPEIYASMYMHFKWEKGVIKVQELSIDRVKMKCVYFYDNKAKDAYPINYHSLVTSISEGFHAIEDKNREIGKTKGIMKEFLIPKGSLVFRDKTGLIVSDHMMLL